MRASSTLAARSSRRVSGEVVCVHRLMENPHTDFEAAGVAHILADGFDDICFFETARDGRGQMILSCGRLPSRPGPWMLRRSPGWTRVLVT
jgi:hypothetical protein